MITPGPWKIEENEYSGSDWLIGTSSRNGKFYAVTTDNLPASEDAGSDAADDARLIAAAPELLAVCKELLQNFELVWRSDPHFTVEGYGSAVLPELFAQAHIAIDKAEGKESQ